MAKFSEIIDSDQPVLVDFFATWCGPCKMMSPILSELKDKVGDQVRILKIDVDQNPGIAQQLQIRGVPTLILFKNKKILWRQSGVVPIHELEAIVQKHTSTPSAP